MRYAVVEDATDLVVNVVEAEEAFEIPAHTMYPGEMANIGDTFDGTNYIPPPLPPASPSFDDSDIMGGTIRDIITS